MSLIERITRKYRHNGMKDIITSFPNFVKYQFKPMMMDMKHVLSIRSETYNIYDEEWDLLIILDACRHDLMKSVADRYEFIESVEYKYSPASSSLPWLRYQFHPKHRDEIQKTTYLTANVFSDEVLDPDNFSKLDEIWKYAWNDELGVVPPRVMTDRAISTARKNNINRMIVHYMQPHFPALDDPELGGQINRHDNKWINDIWSKLESGELTVGKVWNAYEKNLNKVLSEINLLLNNTNFERAIITSDHGNGFGEKGIYGHPGHRIHPCLRKVPWITTSASDCETYTPESYSTNVNDTSVDDKLSALGYINS